MLNPKFLPLGTVLSLTALTLIIQPANVLSQTPTTRVSTPSTLLLDPASKAPSGINLSNPPKHNAGGAHSLDVTVSGGFSVNTDSREQVRSFYNAIYHTSDNVPQNSSADVANNCFPGTNATDFTQAVLRRINWFRAMDGVPATIQFNPTYNAYCQQVAVMISSSGLLNHAPPTNWPCYTDEGRSVSGGNQAGGADGADAITDYIWDHGDGNNEVGHRRWILYPPERIMGTGDVPASSGGITGNCTYVFDPSVNDGRPTTTKPYTAWPPEGFVPYQLVYPYWSFGLSNADLSAATVTMTSNGVPVSVVVPPYQTNIGDNTVVWVPMGLDANSQATVFPFNGSDTVYGITVSNILPPGAANPISFSYTVTVFDPAVAGADYVAPALNGPAQPIVNAANTYTCVPINNPSVTSYQFITSQLTFGNIAEDANYDESQGALQNFTLSPPPNYPPLTNAPDGSTNFCIHLCHATTNAANQLLQLNDVLLPETNASVSFNSYLGLATTDESERIQVSTNGGIDWFDIFVQNGCDSTNQNECDPSFDRHTVSFSGYAGVLTQLRFNYAYDGGANGYWADGYNFEGWCLENLVVSNCQEVANQVTNTMQITNLVSGNFTENANQDETNGLLVNFSFTPSPTYWLITNAPDGSTNYCVHLCHTGPYGYMTQVMQLNETLVPSNNTMLTFDAVLGVATDDETASVQVSADCGNTWSNIFTEVGGNASSTFAPYSFSLGSYAGQQVLLRFVYEYNGGGDGYYADGFNWEGWVLENIVVTNAQQAVTGYINTTNFTFTPTQAGAYLLQTVPVIFDQFPLNGGPALQVNAEVASGITMNTPILSSSQVQLNFTVTGGLTGSYKLLQTAQLGTAWTTNTSAILTTNVPGSSYRFTATKSSAREFYRVLLVP